MTGAAHDVPPDPMLVLDDPRALYAIMSAAYGYWIDPEGTLHEVGTQQHAEWGRRHAEQHNITERDDPMLIWEDRWRIPYIEAGWTRVVAGRRGAVIQGYALTRRVLPTVLAIVRAYAHMGTPLRADFFRNDIHLALDPGADAQAVEARLREAAERDG